MGGCLLNHVAVPGYPVKTALDDIGMKPGGLSVDIDQLVLLTSDDDDGHLQIGILVAEHESVRDHQRRLGG